ncbi:MAG: sulfatase-like hydrolase/transferase [Candidatus Fimadaptatus sp.]
MATTKRPNILFLLTDDQRFDTIHALGNPDIITPNMDYLVSRGAAFTQAHIPGGSSGAVCMPSRAMIHSGRRLYDLDGQGGTIPCEHITLGEALRASGTPQRPSYYCFGTGKWHNGPPAFTRSFDAGDNIFFGGMWDHWNVPVNRYDPTGQYDNEINFVANFLSTNHTMRVHCDKFHPGVHSSELLTQTTLDALDDLPADKPFFVYTAYLAPHDPRTMPRRFEEMYDPEAIHLPPNFRAEHFDFGVHTIRDEVLAAYPRDEREVRRHIAQYYAMITHLDDQIGRIIDKLREKGLLDDTIIVLAGDNGLACGEHGLMGKQSLYEHSVRVPLLISGPGIPAGLRVDNYVYLMDIYPTLCELTGTEIPASVQGISFAPMLRDPGYVTRPELYMMYCELIRAVQDDRFKLIEYRNGPCGNRFQLFDLKADPWELNDLYGTAEYAPVVERLLALRREQRAIWEHSGEQSAKFWREGE